MERKGDLKAVAWRRVERTGILQGGVEGFAGEWKGVCVYVRELRRDDIGTESAFRCHRGPLIKIRIRSLAKWVPCEVRFLVIIHHHLIALQYCNNKALVRLDANPLYPVF